MTGALALAPLLLACSTPPRTTTPSPRFTLEIHSQPVGVIYQTSDLEQRLRQGGGGPVALTLGSSDVSRAVIGPVPSDLIELHLTEPASARFRQVVPRFSETLPFRVRVDGRELFSGVLYTAIGAAAIQSPVLHAADESPTQVVLVIGARQGAAYGMSSDEAARRIDRPELRAALGSRLEQQSSRVTWQWQAGR